MKADERQALFEKLRYELRMAEGFADEINAKAKGITEEDAELLRHKVGKASVTAEKLHVEGFKTNAPF